MVTFPFSIGRPDRADYKPRFFVTTRRPFFTTSTTRRNDVFLSPQEQPPDPCQLDSIDAISMIRGETFIFKGKRASSGLASVD